MKFILVTKDILQINFRKFIRFTLPELQIKFEVIIKNFLLDVIFRVEKTRIFAIPKINYIILAT